MASNQLIAQKPKTAGRRKGSRSYDTRLRDEQAEQTRLRIIQAYGEEVAIDGNDNFTMKQVARRAGVSIPTLYRNFASLDELGDAYWAWFEPKLAAFARIEEPDDLPVFTEGLFARFTEFEPQMLALLGSRAGMRMRDRSAPRRNKIFERILAPLTKDLSEGEAAIATAMCKIMSSGQVWQILRKDWGLDGEEAGKAASWAQRTLMRAIRNNPKSLFTPQKQ